MPERSGFNLVALADCLFGGIAFVHPALSWGIIGFILSALLHFAFLELPKLNLGNLKPVFIGLDIMLVVFVMVSGL